MRVVSTLGVLLVVIGLWARTGYSEPQCTSGFMSLDTLTGLGQVTGGNLKNRDQQQRVIPSINFTCNGSITKWIVAAKWENGGGHTLFPELQIWRTSIFNTYRKVGSSTLSATAENGSNVYEHIPSSPLPFQEGDFLGIFQPDKDTSRLRAYYIDKIGPPNYYYDPDSDTPPTGVFGFFTVTTFDRNQNDQPLVAVEINSTGGGVNCASRFSTREAVEAAAANTLVSRDKQQRIIPNINFTCDGAITKWIVDGEWDDGGMHDWYPDLQIWRSTGTNMFTKVGNTTLRVEGGSDIVTYYEYSLTTPLNFQAGDVLGIFQPDMGKNRLRMHFQSDVGPQNYYETLDNNDVVEPPSDMFVLSTVFQDDLPLITVEFSVSTTTSSLVPTLSLELSSLPATQLPILPSSIQPEVATSLHLTVATLTGTTLASNPAAVSTASSALPTLSLQPTSLPAMPPNTQPSSLSAPFTTEPFTGSTMLAPNPVASSTAGSIVPSLSASPPTLSPPTPPSSLVPEPSTSLPLTSEPLTGSMTLAPNPVASSTAGSIVPSLSTSLPTLSPPTPPSSLIPELSASLPLTSEPLTGSMTLAPNPVASSTAGSIAPSLSTSLPTLSPPTPPSSLIPELSTSLPLTSEPLTGSMTLAPNPVASSTAGSIAPSLSTSLPTLLPPTPPSSLVSEPSTSLPLTSEPLTGSMTLAPNPVASSTAGSIVPSLSTSLPTMSPPTPPSSLVPEPSTSLPLTSEPLAPNPVASSTAGSIVPSLSTSLPTMSPPTLPSSLVPEISTSLPLTTEPFIGSTTPLSRSAPFEYTTTTFPIPTFIRSTQSTLTANTPACDPTCSSSPPSTPGSGSGEEGSPPVAVVLGVLVGAAVGVVSVIVAIFIFRRWKRKKLILHSPSIAMSNLVYGVTDDDSIAKGKYTSTIPKSHFTADDTYDVPTWGAAVYEAIQPESLYEMSTCLDSDYYEIPEWGEYVPTEEQRKVYGDEYAYAAQKPNAPIPSEKVKESFFQECEVYWAPASNPRDLYEQLSKFKFREILRPQLQIVEHLGSGQFGTVNKGVWQSPGGAMEVAIKTLNSGSLEEDRVKFLQEAAIMGQFRHPNVVMLHGVVTIGEPVMIVLELMTLGDMKQYLNKKRPIPGELVPSSMPQICLGFCSQIASGMEYLAGKAFVHRDLAARNILVASDSVCKIADFGMARDLEDHDYYVSKGGRIPVKWTAPEALHYKKYSTASDVWSFGALMYEIWSLGHKPFEGYGNAEVIHMLGIGYRLPPPPGCPKAVYKLMIQCWHPQTSSRPKFSQLLQALCQPEVEILSWSEEDTEVHPQVAVLGSPLEAGKDLYPDLQKIYTV